MLRELTMIFEKSNSISISGNALRIVKARFLPENLLPNDGSTLGVLGFLTCNAAINKLLNGSSLVAQQKTTTLKLKSTAYTGSSTYQTLITNNAGYAWLALTLTPPEQRQPHVQRGSAASQATARAGLPPT
jgi:hypothetical protein